MRPPSPPKTSNFVDSELANIKNLLTAYFAQTNLIAVRCERLDSFQKKVRYTQHTTHNTQHTHTHTVSLTHINIKETGVLLMY